LLGETVQVVTSCLIGVVLLVIKKEAVTEENLGTSLGR